MTISKNHKYNLRQLRSLDYWWNIITGGLLTSIILIPLGVFTLNKIGLNLWCYPYFIFCILAITYYQWSDDNLTNIDNTFSKENNLRLVKICLKRLNWHYNETNEGIELKLNKYFLKFIDPTIIPENRKVLINFKYHSTSRTGRLPFFFGISTYLEWKFKKSLKNIAFTDKLFKF